MHCGLAKIKTELKAATVREIHHEFTNPLEVASGRDTIRDNISSLTIHMYIVSDISLVRLSNNYLAFETANMEIFLH